MEILRQAQGEGVGYVEGGRPFLRMSIKGILRGGLRNRAGAAGNESPTTELVSSSDFDHV